MGGHREKTESAGRELSVTDRLCRQVAATREAGFCVWYPGTVVTFGRRDPTVDSYHVARSVAENLGYSTVERATGGRAVAFTGDVLAFVLAEPADAIDPTIQARYERTTDALLDALEDCGASVQRGEPPDSFCPGAHSLQTGGDGTDGRAGGKVAGLAQRVRRDVAVVAGALVVRNPNAVADVLDPVYEALGVPFDPDSVGSVAAALGSDDATVDPGAIRDEIEATLVGDRSTTALNIRDT